MSPARVVWNLSIAWLLGALADLIERIPSRRWSE